MRQISVIDISALRQGSPKSKGSRNSQREIAEELATVLHETGFVGIQGHGIEPSLIGLMREQVMSLFSLPLESKLALKVQPQNYRGYIPLGFFSPNASGKTADQYEGYKLHFEIDQAEPLCQQCDLYGPNRWPAELPLLKHTVADYWQQCERLTAELLQALCLTLGLARSTFDDAFEQPLSNMTLLRYPPTDSPTDSNASGFGIHPHKDTDALTILAPDAVGGLWLRPRNPDQWIDAQVPPNTLLVNVGDMLETWSGGYFQSTPHKVVNSSGAERVSFPFFAVPRHDVLIEPLVDQSEINMQCAKTFPIASAGEISGKIWHSNWPDAAAIDSNLDPYSH